MKILIIGSKGFIGRHAINYFKNLGHDIFGADVSVDYTLEKYFVIDSTNSDFKGIFENNSFDVCINCSGAASVPDSIEHTLRDFNLNTVNVFKIIDSIKKYSPNCKFINLSSAAVYGSPVSLPIKETDLLSPVSPYGFHKKYSEEILKEYHSLFGTPCCSLRIFSAYGPGLYKQLLWDLYKKISSGKPIVLFGTGNETRDFIHIEDILQCMKLIIDKSNFKADVYNIANGEQIAIRQLADLVINECNFNGSLSFSGVERLGDPLYWVADIEKIKSLGYSQHISIHQGVANYIRWAKEVV